MNFTNPIPRFLAFVALLATFWSIQYLFFDSPDGSRQSLCAPPLGEWRVVTPSMSLDDYADEFNVPVASIALCNAIWGRPPNGDWIVVPYIWSLVVWVVEIICLLLPIVVYFHKEN